MALEVAFVPELVGPNYLAWKRKMIDVLRSKNLWRLVNGEYKNPADVQAMIKWEDKYDEAKGLIG